MGNIWCPRHDTHPLNTHSCRHTKNTFNLQSEIHKHTHTYWRAWAPAEAGVMDSGWLCVSVGISLILSLWPLGKCVYMRVWVCVCERLFQADGGSRGPFCRVNREKLTSTDCCLPFSPFLSPFLCSLHPSKSASMPTSTLSSHPFLLCLLLYLLCLV